MANFSLNIPALGNKLVDLRGRIAGDSFNWSWERPLSQVRYLVVHHSAGPDTQTPADIANYHVQSRGWGGIGYHFVISKDGTVSYVGDLTTARANVLNLNHLVIGICLIGTFMNGALPSDNQINASHFLCSHLLFNTPEASGINGWEDVVGHKQLGATACPGDTWDFYRPKIVTGIGISSTTPDTAQRAGEIANIYRTALGREPDQPGLESYVQSGDSIDQIRKSIVESWEHQSLINKARSFKKAQDLAAGSVASISQALRKVGEITKINS